MLVLVQVKNFNDLNFFLKIKNNFQCLYDFALGLTTDFCWPSCRNSVLGLAALVPDPLGSAPTKPSSSEVEFEFQYNTCRPSDDECVGGGGGRRKRDVDDAPIDTITADVSKMFENSCPPAVSWVALVKLYVDPGSGIFCICNYVAHYV